MSTKKVYVRPKKRVMTTYERVVKTGATIKPLKDQDGAPIDPRALVAQCAGTNRV